MQTLSAYMAHPIKIPDKAQVCPWLTTLCTCCYISFLEEITISYDNPQRGGTSILHLISPRLPSCTSPFLFADFNCYLFPVISCNHEYYTPESCESLKQIIASDGCPGDTLYREWQSICHKSYLIQMSIIIKIVKIRMLTYITTVGYSKENNEKLIFCNTFKPPISENWVLKSIYISDLILCQSYIPSFMLIRYLYSYIDILVYILVYIHIYTCLYSSCLP